MSRSDGLNCVLVAGGAGFVGSSVVRRLAVSGRRVVVADNLTFGSRANIENLGNNVEFVEHDFCDSASTGRLIDRIQPRHAISCVGDTFVTSAYEDPGRFINNNFVANLNIIRACAKVDCDRIVYLSSTEIYGDRTAGPLSEIAPYDPVNTYAVTKLAADRIAYTYALEHGAKIFIARIFNTYGPRETHAYIVPEIIEQLSKSDQLVLGNIEAARDFTFVADTARAICMLLDADAPNGSAFNIGSNVDIKVKDMAAAIAIAMGKPNFKLSVDSSRFRRRDIQSFRADYSRLHQVTGWQPEVSLEEGLRETIDWFQRNGRSWPWDKAAIEERLFLAEAVV